MDICASVFLSFPPDNEPVSDNETYDRAVKVFVAKLNKLIKEHGPTVQASAAELLGVGYSPHKLF